MRLDVLAAGSVLAALAAAGCVPAGARPTGPLRPEAKAVAFLCREVPRWSRENHCYSCHNNGDAAQALYQAARSRLPGCRAMSWPTRRAGSNSRAAGSTTAARARSATSGWPGWFSRARSSTAVSTGAIKDRSFLLEARQRLAADQAADGSWPLEGEDTDSARRRPTASRWPRWSRGRPCSRPTASAIAPPSTVPTAGFSAARSRRHRCRRWRSWRWSRSLPAANHPRRKLSLDLLRRAQTDDGGWGPRPGSPPEPFDTALALLALAHCGDRSRCGRPWCARGRAFLVAQQRDDGSWIETTRPAGNVSYAQRISTAGWATRACSRPRGLRPDPLRRSETVASPSRW